MRALLLTTTTDGLSADITDVPVRELPDGEVQIAISHSSLNYKDGLAVTGRGKIVRAPFPFVPGIDLVGTVEASASSLWTRGDAVVLTGWGTGEDRWGGFAERASARADHLVALPDGLTPAWAMALGTAGFTAMLAVMALEHAGIKPESGPVAVTGASGGVGSVATALLAHQGYAVHASTGTASAHAYLRRLGASEIVHREALSAPPSKGLGAASWAGAVDSVGGTTLATLLATTQRRGCVAACGLAGGPSLDTTVFPFILRGVTLAGIDSNTSPLPEREQAWARLADAVAAGALDALDITTIALDDIPVWSDRIVRGQTVGRVVVDVQA